MNTSQPFQYYPFYNYNPICYQPNLMFPGNPYPFLGLLDTMQHQPLETQEKVPILAEQPKTESEEHIKVKTQPPKEDPIDDEASVYIPYTSSKGSKNVMKRPKTATTSQAGEGPCICNNRNMNSNLLRVFFRRMEYKIKRELKLIGKIIEKHHMKITLADFLDWYERNKINHRNYIRINSVKKLFMSQYFNEEYTKVIRVLLNHFIRNESFNCYLTSKKVSKEEARNNFLAFRTIIDNILFLQE